jgi:hypothetical protein
MCIGYALQTAMRSVLHVIHVIGRIYSRINLLVECIIYTVKLTVNSNKYSSLYYYSLMHHLQFLMWCLYTCRNLLHNTT